VKITEEEQNPAPGECHEKGFGSNQVAEAKDGTDFVHLEPKAGQTRCHRPIESCCEGVRGKCGGDQTPAAQSAKGRGYAYDETRQT
jgi:hypothetical protein